MAKPQESAPSGDFKLRTETAVASGDESRKKFREFLTRNWRKASVGVGVVCLITWGFIYIPSYELTGGSSQDGVTETRVPAPTSPAPSATGETVSPVPVRDTIVLRQGDSPFRKDVALGWHLDWWADVSKVDVSVEHRGTTKIGIFSLKPGVDTASVEYHLYP